MSHYTVTRKDIITMYQTMTRIRLFEEKLLEVLSSGEITGVIHPYIGHEAIAVGACSSLEMDDIVVSYYRGHGHALAKGVDMSQIMAEIFGRKTGLCQGKGGSMHLVDWTKKYLGGNAIVGANIPIALGTALAIQVQQTNQIVVVFFGDGVSGAGVFHESLNIASTQNLPIVFICENNGYQDLTRSESVLTSTDLLRLGLAHGIPSFSIDGNDVIQVRNTVTLAVTKTRSGNGPIFIEAKTYLLRFHSQIGICPPSEYRPADEVERWKQHDPLIKTRKQLLEMGVKADLFQSIEKAVNSEIESALSFARLSPWPDPEDLWKDIFTQ